MAETLDLIIRAQNQASAALNGLRGELDKLSKDAKTIGTGLTVGVTAPFTLFAKQGLTTMAEFSQSMAQIEAISGATGEQMQTLTDTAIRLGAETSFSANEAAGGMLELLKAGMDTEQTLASIPGVLSLAAAGGVDLATSASVTAAALNTFGLEAGQAEYVANLLAAAANSSSANISDLAMGLQQGGFAFNAAGQDVDDLAASLAILTNVGLTGSDAGTALKNAFIRMISPTKEARGVMNDLGIAFFNAKGDMRPLSDIIADLNTATSGLTEEQRLATLETIFLSDGMKGMIPLLNVGKDGFLEMKIAVNEAGAAQKLADARMRGLAGAFEYASGSIESAMLTIWQPFEATLAGLIRQGADFITWISQLPRPVLNAALAFAAVLAVAGPLLLALPSITAFISAMLGPIGLVVLAVAGLAAAWASNFGDIQGKTTEVVNAIKESISTGNLQPVLDVLGDIGSEIVTEVGKWATTFVDWATGIWGKVSPGLLKFSTSVTNWISQKSASIGLRLKEWATEFTGWVTDVWPTLSTNLVTMWESFTGWISGQADVLYTYMYKWATEFWAWAGEVWAELSPKLVDLFTSLTTWISEQATTLPTKLAAWATAFVDWASTAWTDVLPKLTAYGTSLKEWAEEQEPILKKATKSWAKVLSEWVPKEPLPLKPLGTSLRTGILGLQETVGTAIGYMIGAAFGGAIRAVANVVAIFVTGIIGSINMAFASEDNKSSASDALGGLVSGMFANVGKSLGAIGVGFRDQLQATFDDAIMGIRDEEWAKLTANMTMVWSNMVNGVTGAATDLRNSLTMSFLTLKISVSNHIESMYNDAVFRLALMAYKAGSLAGEAKDAVIGKFNELAGAAGTAIDSLRSTVESKFNGIKSWIEGLSISNPFASVVGWANSAVSAVQNAWGVISGGGGGGGSRHAAGTMSFRGGMTTLNERGTELIALPGRNRQAWLPRGSQIYPAEQVPLMMGGGGGNVTVYATVTNQADEERLAWRIADIIRRNS